MDVEAGQDRALLRARLELGNADQVHAFGDHAVDRKLVVEPGARRPIDRDFDIGVGIAKELNLLDARRIRIGDSSQMDFAVR